MTERMDLDEDTLRRALTVIGEEAGRADALTQRRKRRTRQVALMAAASVVVASAVVLSLSGDDGGEDPDVASKALTEVQQAACTETLVEGKVISVKERSGVGEDAHLALTVTLDVTEWLVPRAGADSFTLDVPKPDGPGGSEGPPLKVGERLLLLDLVGAGDVFYFRDDSRPYEDLDEVRPKMEAALAEAEATGTMCPDFWLNR